MSIRVHVIDAFTSIPFKGNPAAVCLLDHFPDDAVMQNIAMEMNLSETAFLVERERHHYLLRWFTPRVEVNLCGHATLAATHFLWEMGKLKAGSTVTYRTLSGELHARMLDSGIELDFPALPGNKTISHRALESLGVEIIACEKNRDNYLVEVRNYRVLQMCTPVLGGLLGLDRQGVIVTTAKGVPIDYDFASRYFAPVAGVDEDPVTGSAHCFLAPYWAKKLGNKAFHAFQASRRGGVLDVVLDKERVKIRGTAVTTMRGELYVQAIRKEKVI